MSQSLSRFILTSVFFCFLGEKRRDLTRRTDKITFTDGIQKSKATTQDAAKATITQRLRADFGRSVGVTTSIILVW